MPLGYSIYKGENIMQHAVNYTRESLRAPVVETKSASVLKTDFISTTSDTRLTFLRDLVANDKRSLALDDLGKIIFPPDQEIAMLQPVWTYDDDNSSILYPDLNITRDLYGIPNVVEVLYSGNSNNPIFSRVVNDDPNSITSIQARGREIIHRDTSPSIAGGINNTDVTQQQVDEYAKELLKQLSSLEYTLEYTHGYCPVRIGDGVRLNYTRADVLNTRAKVTRQIIQCVSGCSVQETAVYTKQLWNPDSLTEEG